MEAKRKKFGMELLPDLHRRMKQLSLDTGMPIWQITQNAMEAYFKIHREAAFRPQHSEQHDLLEFILEHGTADDRNWISGNLKNFVEAIQARVFSQTEDWLLIGKRVTRHYRLSERRFR